MAASCLGRERASVAETDLWFQHGLSERIYGSSDELYGSRNSKKPSNFNSPHVRESVPSRATAADPVFATCLRVARRAVAGLLPDPTGGATHYHAVGLHPDWAAGHGPCAEIGRHVFYNTTE